MKATNLIWTLLVLILLSACNKDDSFGYDEDYDDTETSADNQDGGYEGSLTLYSVMGDDIDKKKDFSVTGTLETYQQDYGKHLKMWEFIKKLIPQNERMRIDEFMIFYGDNDLAGYVEPINGDLSTWRFGMAIELANNIEEIDFEDFFTYVTVHELGHIITLNETQVDGNAWESNCNNYYPGEGCAQKESYINKLFELGWTDIYKGEEGDETLYDDYTDRFLTDYAATNPAEDIAEVFAYFVTEEDRPTGNTIAEQKVQLLYDFPELVKLREEMRNHPTLRRIKPGSWEKNPVAKNFRFGRCQHKHHKHQVAEKSAAH